MTIVDRQHAAQLVTNKGKVYNFDAAECLIHSLPEFDQTAIALYLVTDYEEPEQLIDATSATFIVTPEIPSPMRANLSALKSRERALALQGLKQGDLYSWQEIQLHLKN
jgi:copper chaperone NosL